MLGKAPLSPLRKSVCLLLENGPLRALIEALLLEWGYHLSDRPADQPLLIIGDDQQRPAGFEHVLTLTTSHYQDRKRIEIPLTIEVLYLALENHFHRTPRHHIRIQLEWPIRVRVRGCEFDTHTVTVADRGIRFVSPFEMAREEEMEIRIEREDEIYDLQARAVYSIVGREIGRNDWIEVGAVCIPQSKEVRESIRSRIIGSYLKRVRPVLGESLFIEAQKQLNLTRMTQEMVSDGRA